MKRVTFSFSFNVTQEEIDEDSLPGEFSLKDLEKDEAEALKAMKEEFHEDWRKCQVKISMVEVLG